MTIQLRQRSPQALYNQRLLNQVTGMPVTDLPPAAEDNAPPPTDLPNPGYGDAPPAGGSPFRAQYQAAYAPAAPPMPYGPYPTKDPNAPYENAAPPMPYGYAYGPQMPYPSYYGDPYGYPQPYGYQQPYSPYPTQQPYAPYGYPAVPGVNIVNQQAQNFADSRDRYQTSVTGLVTPGVGLDGSQAPPFYSVPYAMQYAQNFGYDPRTYQQTLAGQSQEEQRNQAILNRFGQYTTGGTQPSAPGLAGQQMSARAGIQQDMMKAEEQRNQLQDAYGAQQQQMVPQVAAPAYGNPGQIGLPMPGTLAHSYSPGQVSMAGQYNPRPSYISGPASGMSVDQGASNTMRGNQAFGLHTERPTSGPGAVGKSAADLQHLGASTVGSPQGESDYDQLTRMVLGDPNDPTRYPRSPRADLLMRGEDPGVYGTPTEKAWQAVYLQRRRSGGGLPMPQF